LAESLGHKATTGAIWASIDRFGIMVLQFVVNLILARLLLPQDFGAVGMLAIFIAVSQVLIDGGFGSALIQKKEPTQTDYSTILFWNIGFSSVLYLILFICAPVISEFFSMPILSDVLRVMGLSLIINSVFGIQKNRLQKQLAFKLIAIMELSSYVIGAVVAITLAYYGFGVWSLVAMQIVSGLTSVLTLWLITHWLPSICFSLASMKELFGFGGFILAAGLLQEICKNLQGIIIGRKFSATEMGYFSQAYKLDQIACYSIPQVIVQVMYPVYSSIQDDKQRLIEILSMNIRVISFLIFPILSMLILIGEPLIQFLYGEKWLPSVPYFQVLCVGGFFICLQNVNFYAVAAVGKSKQLFFWSFYKWGFLILALLVGMVFGMYGILWGMVLSNFNIYAVNAYLAARNVGMKLRLQTKCLLPITIATTIAFAIGYACLFYVGSFIMGAIAFLAVYISICFLFHYKAMKESLLLIERLIHRT
jgi:Membrane protein involved in the export of O-antigen and teichoic acid